MASEASEGDVSSSASSTGAAAVEAFLENAEPAHFGIRSRQHTEEWNALMAQHARIVERQHTWEQRPAPLGDAGAPPAPHASVDELPPAAATAEDVDYDGAYDAAQYAPTAPPADRGDAAPPAHSSGATGAPAGLPAGALTDELSELIDSMQSLVGLRPEEVYALYGSRASGAAPRSVPRARDAAVEAAGRDAAAASAGGGDAASGSGTFFRAVPVGWGDVQRDLNEIATLASERQNLFDRHLEQYGDSAARAGLLDTQPPVAEYVPEHHEHEFAGGADFEGAPQPQPLTVHDVDALWRAADDPDFAALLDNPAFLRAFGGATAAAAAPAAAAAAAPAHVPADAAAEGGAPDDGDVTPLSSQSLRSQVSWWTN
jgi:hypothetical protein